MMSFEEVTLTAGRAIVCACRRRPKLYPGQMTTERSQHSVSLLNNLAKEGMLHGVDGKSSHTVVGVRVADLRR